MPETYIEVTNSPEPATPTAGVTLVYVDDVTKRLRSKDDAGIVVEYQGIEQPPSLILVSDCGPVELRGEYALVDTFNGFPRYAMGLYKIYHEDNQWVFFDFDLDYCPFRAVSTVADPTLIDNWILNFPTAGALPVITRV